MRSRFARCAFCRLTRPRFTGTVLFAGAAERWKVLQHGTSVGAAALLVADDRRGHSAFLLHETDATDFSTGFVARWALGSAWTAR